MSPRKWNSPVSVGALRPDCPTCGDSSVNSRHLLSTASRKAAILAAGLALLGGCTRHKPPRPFFAPRIAARTAPKGPELILPPPPELVPGELELVVLVDVPTSLENLRLPPPPPPPKAPPPAPAPSKPEVVETPPPATPQLAQIITPAQRAAYTRELDESLDRIRRAVASLAGRRLSASQQEALDSIRTFQRQAEQAREQDLVTAVSLARRADLLAKDLLQRLP